MTIAESKIQNSKFKIPRLSWAWRITIGYLSLMLFLPVAALLLQASTVRPVEFWQIATSPVALSAYNVTFVTALLAALLNGVFGTLVAWVLVRYDFPLKRLIDAAIDLPFALPTSVAGLTLATVYSENGWIGSLLAPLGIKVAFTRLGVGIAMVFISIPFVVRTLQPVLQEMEQEIEEAAWSLGASRWQTFWRVILPPLFPALLTGIALGFSRAVGEYGSIVIVASKVWGGFGSIRQHYSQNSNLTAICGGSLQAIRNRSCFYRCCFTSGFSISHPSVERNSGT